MRTLVPLVLAATLGIILFLTLEAMATEDVTGPAITTSTWSISPTTVDTTSGAQTVTFALTITDALTGFSRGTIYLKDSGNTSQGKFIHFDAAQRTSGDANSGVYSVPYSMPQYSDVGSWTLGFVEVIDALGNSKAYWTGDAIFGAYTTLTTQ